MTTPEYVPLLPQTAPLGYMRPDEFVQHVKFMLNKECDLRSLLQEAILRLENKL